MKGSGFGVNWFESLCELYRRNEDIVGEYKKDKFGNDLILVPIYHSTLIAQITVYLNLDGDFLNATTIARNDALTLIPVTEESSVRTRNCAPHPLCDGLKYVPTLKHRERKILRNFTNNTFLNLNNGENLRTHIQRWMQYMST